MEVPFPPAFAAMALAALLLPSAPTRLRGGLGLPAYALGAASMPFLADVRGPDVALWVSAALLLLGPALLLLAAWRARLHHQLPLLVVAIGAAIAGLAAAWPTLRLGGIIPAALTAGAIALGGLFLWMLGSALGVGRAVRRLDARLSLSRGDWPWGALIVTAAALLIGTAALKWPLWIELWQSVGVAVGVLLTWWAVGTGRAPLGLAGAAFACAFTAPELAYSSWLLLGVAAMAVRSMPRAAGAVAAAGGYLGVRALLSGEVLYTVLLVGAATALLGALAGAATTEGPAPR